MTLRLTLYPDGPGPYDRWDLVVEVSNEVLASGPTPIDADVVQAACTAFHERAENEERIWRMVKNAG